MVDTLGEAAAALADEPEQVAALQGAAARLLQARRDAQLHGAALQALHDGYAAGGEPTDFAAELEQRTAAAQEAAAVAAGAAAAAAPG